MTVTLRSDFESEDRDNASDIYDNSMDTEKII